MAEYSVNNTFGRHKAARGSRRQRPRSSYRHEAIAHLHKHAILFVGVVEVDIMSAGCIYLCHTAQITNLILLQPAHKLPEMVTALLVVFWSKGNPYAGGPSVVSLVCKSCHFKSLKQTSECFLQFFRVYAPAGFGVRQKHPIFSRLGSNCCNSRGIGILR